MAIRFIFFACLLALTACDKSADETDAPPEDSAGGDGSGGDDSGGDGGDSGETDCSDRDYSQIPSGRGELAGGWDPAGRFVLFGGNQGVPEECSSSATDFSGETWIFHDDCGNFERVEVDASAAPAARGRFAGAVDPVRGWWIVHGGRWRDVEASSSASYDLFDDVWAFDFATDTWTQLSDGGGPSARVSHAAGVSGDSFIIYGGNTSASGTSYNAQGDTWIFDLDSLEWTELDTENAPDDRLFHGGALSADGGTLYVTAGGDENAFFGSFFRDTWALDIAAASWTQLHDGGDDAPEGTIGGGVVVDDAGGRLISWAGHDDGVLGNNNQVWAFDLSAGTWSQLEEGDVYANAATGTCDFPADFTEPDLDAPERRYQAATAATPDGRLATFGGKTDCGVINDVWTYDMTVDSWTERSPATSGEICLRAFAECESLCY